MCNGGLDYQKLFWSGRNMLWLFRLHNSCNGSWESSGVENSCRKSCSCWEQGLVGWNQDGWLFNFVSFFWWGAGREQVNIHFSTRKSPSNFPSLHVYTSAVSGRTPGRPLCWPCYSPRLSLSSVRRKMYLQRAIQVSHGLKHVLSFITVRVWSN